MSNRKQEPDARHQPWKRKMGVELSGLERPRDFLVAFLFLATLLVIAAVIAYMTFG